MLTPHLASNPLTDLRVMWSYAFMVNAFRAGSVVAVLSGAVGWFMVLRRQSFIGHTLAVVSFPGAAGAVWLGVSVTWGYFAGTLCAAAVLALLTGRRVPGAATTRLGRGGDSAVVGTVQAVALAVGALFVSLYGGFSDSLTGLLFGTFLGISTGQVLALTLVAMAVLLVLVVMARPLFFASVDESVAHSRGLSTATLGLVFLVILAATAAETSQITGALLVFALLVLPPAAARTLTARPVVGVVLAVGIGLVSVWVSLTLAFFSTYPVGFYLTTVGIVLYGLCVAGVRVAAPLRALHWGSPPTLAGSGA